MTIENISAFRRFKFPVKTDRFAHLEQKSKPSSLSAINDKLSEIKLNKEMAANNYDE